MALDLIRDNFDYSAGALATVSAGVWVERSGFQPFSGATDTNWQVSSGRISWSSNDKNILYAATMPTLPSEYDIEVVARQTSASGTGEWCIVFRHDGSQNANGLMLFIKKGGTTQWQIQFKTAGFGDKGTSALGPTIVSNQEYTFKIEVRGNSIRALIDGVEVKAAQTITDFASNTKVGLVGASISANSTQITSFAVIDPNRNPPSLGSGMGMSLKLNKG